MRPGTERLLLVDDDVKNQDLLSCRLAQSGYEVDIAGSAAGVLEKIGGAQYDLVLLDQMMPGLTGLDLLRLLRATYSPQDVPAVMVTALDQGQAVVDALQGSAASPERARSRPARGTFDTLTRLGNRLTLLDRLGTLAGERAGFAVLLLDLDGFKVINDSFGHITGDAILREAAERLKKLTAHCPLPCSVARIGGDEFGIVLERMPDAEMATRFAAAVLDEIRRPYLIHGRDITVSASLGMRIAGDTGPNAEDLLRDADLAMYRAKELGKNRWQMFQQELRERALTRMTLVQDLRRAIERNQLFPAYQAKVDLQTRRILGFEALARWRHPERGLILPGTFIPLAEETGLIIPIGEWILGAACSQLKKWQTQFPLSPPLTMSVNLSVKQLSDPNLPERIRSHLERTGISAESLRLELTESALMTDLESSREALARVQALGISLKLDDFGTGYSSFSYLESLHFNSLKIDQSFVARVNTEPESQAIVDSIIRLAHALDMTVVAEGIEKPEQADVLARLGCDAGQGFYFSRPVETQCAEEQLRAMYGG